MAWSAKGVRQTVVLVTVVALGVGAYLYFKPRVPDEMLTGIYTCTSTTRTDGKPADGGGIDDDKRVVTVLPGNRIETWLGGKGDYKLVGIKSGPRGASTLRDEFLLVVTSPTIPRGGRETTYTPNRGTVGEFEGHGPARHVARINVMVTPGVVADCYRLG